MMTFEQKIKIMEKEGKLQFKNEIRDCCGQTEVRFNYHLSVDTQMGLPYQKMKHIETILKIASQYGIEKIKIDGDIKNTGGADTIVSALKKGYPMDYEEPELKYVSPYQDETALKLMREGYNIVPVLMYDCSDGDTSVLQGEYIEKKPIKYDYDVVPDRDILNKEDIIYYVESRASAMHAPYRYFLLNGERYYRVEEILQFLSDFDDGVPV